MSHFARLGVQFHNKGNVSAACAFFFFFPPCKFLVVCQVNYKRASSVQPAYHITLSVLVHRKSEVDHSKRKKAHPRQMPRASEPAFLPTILFLAFEIRHTVANATPV